MFHTKASQNKPKLQIFGMEIYHVATLAGGGTKLIKIKFRFPFPPRGLMVVGSGNRKFNLITKK